MATTISSFRKHVLPDVPGCPNFMIDDAVVDGIQQFCIDTLWLEKAIEDEDIDYTTIDATDNDSIEVDLTSYVTDITPYSFTRFQIDGADYDLEYLNLVNDNSNLDQITKTGVKFYNLPDQDTIKIFPFTDQAANFDLYLKIVFKPKDGITSIDDVFYDDFRDAICGYAKSKLQRIPKKNWTDLEQANINAQTYRSGMGKAKIKHSYGRVTGTASIKPPSFC